MALRTAQYKQKTDIYNRNIFSLILKFNVILIDYLANGDLTLSTSLQCQVNITICLEVHTKLIDIEVVEL